MNVNEKKSSDVIRKDAKKGSSSVCYMDEFPDYFGLEKEQESKNKDHSNKTKPTDLRPS
tara:strand:- start:571 stop:747 length:177 start_codon:yes stop_codon:yes gene_type:complete